MPASRDLPHKEKRIARRSAGDEHGTRQRDQELRRARGEIACIECQRSVFIFYPKHMGAHLRSKISAFLLGLSCAVTERYVALRVPFFQIADGRSQWPLVYIRSRVHHVYAGTSRPCVQTVRLVCANCLRRIN